MVFDANPEQHRLGRHRQRVHRRTGLIVTTIGLPTALSVIMSSTTRRHIFRHTKLRRMDRRRAIFIIFNTIRSTRIMTNITTITITIMVTTISTPTLNIPRTNNRSQSTVHNRIRIMTRLPKFFIQTIMIKMRQIDRMITNKFPSVIRVFVTRRLLPHNNRTVHTIEHDSNRTMNIIISRARILFTLVTNTMVIRTNLRHRIHTITHRIDHTRVVLLPRIFRSQTMHTRYRTMK